MDHHLGLGKHEHSDSSNNRNGYTSKTLHTEEGQIEVATPRDREGSFEPQCIEHTLKRRLDCQHVHSSNSSLSVNWNSTCLTPSSATRRNVI